MIGERLAMLEKSPGVVPLRRTTREFTRTEDGTAFLDRVTRIIREVEDATAEIAARRGMLRGPLHISAPVTFGHMHLRPAFYPFPAADPGIALTLDLDDRGVSTAAEGFDAILRHGPIDLEIDFSEQNRYNSCLISVAARRAIATLNLYRAFTTRGIAVARLDAIKACIIKGLMCFDRPRNERGQ